MSFHCITLATAQASYQASSPAYVYRLDRIRDNAQRIGAYHGAEIPYVSGTHTDWLSTTDENRALTEKMMAMWPSFAATGAPSQSQDWPIWDRNACGISQNTQTTPVRLDTELCEHLGFSLQVAALAEPHICQWSNTVIR